MAIFKLTLIKASPYKAETEEEWSNSYHFSGTEPADAAAWATFAEAVWALEGQFIFAASTRTHLVRAYGYSPGSDIATYVGDFTAGGTTAGIVPAGGGLLHVGAGGQDLSVCALLRFQCGLSSHTGRPRYIMKYVHDQALGYSGPDVAGPPSTAGSTALAKFHDGTLTDGAVLCAPDGTLATSGILSNYFTTHQIKRRGKRPRRGA